jgi:hypothetical protein
VAFRFHALLHPARYGGRIEQPVLRNDGEGLRTDGSFLKTDVSGSRTDSSGLRTDRSFLNPDVSGLRKDKSVLSKNPDFPHFLMKAPQKSLFRGERRC